MWYHIAISEWLEGEVAVWRSVVADVESFAEKMSLHAPTCFIDIAVLVIAPDMSCSSF